MGTKTAVNEFVAYNNLGTLQKAGELHVSCADCLSLITYHLSAEIRSYRYICSLRVFQLLVNGNEHRIPWWPGSIQTFYSIQSCAPCSLRWLNCLLYECNSCWFVISDKPRL